MMRSFYNGVSGVKTHSYGMDLLANNISNINTVGYKAAVPEFKDIFYQTGLDVGGLNNFGANQVGLAASGLSSAYSQKQGALVISDRTFDVALEGKGFFGIKDLDGKTYYTRNGSFDVDKDYNLVDNFGRFVLGTMNSSFSKSVMNENIKQMYGKASSYDGFTITNDDLDIKLNSANKQEKITLPNTLFMNANPTKNVSIKANLDKSYIIQKEYIPTDKIKLIIDNNKSKFSAKLEPNAKVLLDINKGLGTEKIELSADKDGNLSKELDTKVFNFKASLIKDIKKSKSNKFEIATYDNNGNIRKLTLKLNAKDDLKFDLIARLEDNNSKLIEEKKGEVSFNKDGSLQSNNLTNIAGVDLNLGTKNGFDGLTCIDNNNMQRMITADGYMAGILKDYNINDNGNVVANFTNGKSKAIAKVAVFNFINEQGLSKNGENEFSVTSDSGEAMFFYDKNQNPINPYKIKSHFLEQSNVDLGTELTQVIVFQKAYEANAKSITTADAMLKRAIEMKK